MRFRNVKNKENIINNSTSFIKEPQKYRGKWHTLFSNKNKICVEIGIGKGKFIIEHAKKYPDINFIGIEKFDSILARALEKLETKRPNLYIIRLDAKDIEEVFDHEIDQIYLNFSDPWPKKRHAKRRLTAHEFLKRYDSIFCGEKKICFRTDNMTLFEFSLESLSTYGYILKDIKLDLHNETEEDLITTEYEDKFVKLKNNIYEVKAYKKE